MKIGFTTTTFRNIKDVRKICDIAVNAGVNCIEWGADVHVKNAETAEYVYSLCAERNIEISSYASYYKVGSSNETEWESICRTARALNASSVRVWLGKKDSEKTDEKTYMQILRDAESMCKTAEKYSLIVCPECHDNTFNNNTDAFLRIKKDIGCDNFRTYFQSRYKKLGYDLDRIERTLPYIESVHISFSELRREQFPKYEPIYMDKLLDKLLECGFDGNLLLEYTYLWGRYGIVSCMEKDILKLKEKVGIIK